MQKASPRVFPELCVQLQPAPLGPLQAARLPLSPLRGCTLPEPGLLPEGTLQ